MLNWSGLLSLVVTALAVMGSPGPATISVTAVGAGFGARRAFPYVCGVVAGTTLVLLAVALGLSAALLAVPGLAPVLAGASVGYVVYLAWRIATAPPLQRFETGTSAPTLWSGLVLGIANPKAYIAIAAVFATGRLAPAPFADALARTAVLTALIVLIHLAWLWAGTSLTGILRNPTASRVANIALAAAMLVASLAALLGPSA